MTVVVTSETPGLLTQDDASAVLASVRVERCSAVMGTIIAMAADMVQAVPEFDPDPLGKTYPDGDQPPLDMMNTFAMLSTEQAAYLLPFEPPVDACVAEALQSQIPDVFFGMGMNVFGAVRGEQQDALQSLADAC